MTPPDPLDFERQLNEQQLAAVTHGDGPQLVLAGAGSGKTRVITYRVAWLVAKRGAAPDSIVAMTFTNKAAAEMRERIGKLLGLEPLPTFVGTFHRFALGMLRRWGDRVGVARGFAIFDRDDQIRLVKKALEKEGLAESSFPPRSMLAAIGSAKNRLLDPAAFESQATSFFDQRAAAVYRHYQGLLQQAAGVDFDDMLRLSVKLLKKDVDLADRLRDKIDYLLVDEFQDTNHAQMEMVKELVGTRGHLTAVGDEDQGIYRWRGADLDNVLAFEKSFPGATVRKLERNYRSTQNILTAADAVVAHNQQRRGKTLWTDAGAGDAIELYRARDEQDEAKWVARTLRELHADYPWREMGVLVRTNAQTRALEERFLRQQVPYELVGGVRFYERAEVKDVVAYLRVLRNPRDDFSLLRIINQPPRGIGKATLAELMERVDGSRRSVWDALVSVSPDRFAARAAKALGHFRETVEALRKAAEELTLPELVDRVLEDTGLLALYDKSDSDSQARLENLREVESAAQEFAENAEVVEGSDALTAFLDHVALVADVDAWRGDRGVSLMTLHSAKGLEFEVVVVAGLEDGVLPHFNSMGTEEGLEEERRLLYVGMTRAGKKLMLTTCRRRRIAGRYQNQEPSRFLSELPSEGLEETQSPELFVTPQTEGVRSFFDLPTRDRHPAAGEPAAGPGLTRGAKVRHPTLGNGVVLHLEGQGPAGKLTVYFERFGKRKLAAKYASLEVL